MSRIAITSFKITCLLCTVFLVGLAANIQPVKADYAWTGTIYIRADGNVEPSVAPISTSDNATYALTEDIAGIPENSSAIVIERSNIMIDGVGHTLQGSGGGTGFSLSGVGNITIRNTSITSFLRGIRLNGSSSNFLTGNSLANNGYGIYLNSSSENTLSGNNIATNKYSGILLGYSSNNSITRNNMTDNGSGIRFDYSSNNTLSGNGVTASLFEGISLFYSPNNIFRNNTMIGNKYNFAYQFWATQEIDLSNFMNDIDVSNSVNGKPIFYLINKQDITINPQTYPSIGYLAVVNSTNITVRDLEMEDNGQGVLFAYTNNSSIENVTTRNNSVGIRLSYSSNNRVARNNVTGCTNYHGIILDISSDGNFLIGNNIMANDARGVGLYKSSNNTIVENNIAYNNDDAIYLYKSNSNSIYHNNFMNNTVQARVWDSSTNTWDDGYPYGGNYWSDYNGTDLYSGSYQNETGFDWIGDTPYIVDENNTDRFPLMQPYVSEIEETYIAYRNLLLRFAETRSQLEALNSTLARLTDEIASAQSQLDSLNETVSTMSTDIHSLNDTITSLQQQTTNLNTTLSSTRSELSAGISSLATQVSDLQERLDSLNSTLQSSINTQQSNYNLLTGQLNTILNVTYALAAATAVLIVAVAYLIIRKPKTKPET